MWTACISPAISERFITHRACPPVHQSHTRTAYLRLPAPGGWDIALACARLSAVTFGSTFLRLCWHSVAI